MRAYLLGALGEKESAVLEEKYFSNPLLFKSIRDNEDELIRDYLENRLAEPERDRFEGRYLTVPELTKRVETVRAANARSGPYRMRWQVVFTGFAVAACAFLAWRVSHERVAGPSAARVEEARTVPPGAPPVLRLSPGVTMGAGAKTNEIGQGRVRLKLELPGRAAPLDCIVAIAGVAADGRQQRVWTSGALKSAAAGTGQEVSADPAVLRPGDYIAEVDSAGGNVLEKYVFRVIPGR